MRNNTFGDAADFRKNFSGGPATALVNMIKDFIRELVPPILLKPIRKIRHGIQNRGKLIPPEELIFVGGGDFERIGKDFFRIFVEYGGLKPNQRVLDVGCGVGRMAVPLTKYPVAQYEGFDIVPEGIDWCAKKISRRHPNFHFQRVDIRNKTYNPDGKYTAAEFKFPYESETFDFVFLTSVFTHMLPADMENYLSEISRVLKIGGRMLSSLFLLNFESMKLVHAGISDQDFRCGAGIYRTVDDNDPEAAIAYIEEYVRRLYTENGLDIVEPIHYGYWCGRKKFLSYQDIIVAAKR